MKTKEFRDMTVEELETRKKELREQAFHMRIQQQTGQLEKPSELRSIRRGVARIETILSERRLKSANEAAK